MKVGRVIPNAPPSAPAGRPRTGSPLGGDRHLSHPPPFTSLSPRPLRAFLLFVFSLALLALTTASLTRAAEKLPPAPPNHFNDFAGLVTRDTATQLNQALAQFERDTSNQLLVAIYRELPPGASVEDYTVRLAQSWRAGQKARDNGAVLFVFQASRDLRIQVGYGLEAVLPDALCKRIIEEEIIPRFRAGDFDAGLAAGVRAMMAATRGEYRGSGRLATDARGRTSSGGSPSFIVIVIVALILISALRANSRRETIYGRRGRRTIWLDRGGWGGGFGGGGWGGGGGGGGSFSGGGGSFGGGGAGGKW